MKKVFINILAIVFSLNAFCQGLTFMGVPLNGTKTEFSRQLLEKGFSYIPNDADSAMGGMFYGESCILQHIVNAGVINGVNVILVPDDNWPFLYAKYKSMKMKLAKEYGEPTKDEEIFDTRVEPRTDAQKYEAVNNGKCQYQCYWFTPGVGGVAMTITHLKSGENAVIISYLTMNDLTTSAPHIKFKGISLGETPYNFASELERQGYTYVTKMDDTYVLTGAFAGYSNCNLYITAAQYDNTVDHVGINFPNQTRWEYLLNTYNNLKDMLTQKYGKPVSCIEKFNTSNTSTSEYKIMSLLKQDEFKYETLFFIEGGYVKLIISHLYVNYEHSFYVSLIYVDGASTITTNKRAIDDL